MIKSDLIYDWNRVDGPELNLARQPLLNDETLRDGLQSPSVLDPPIENKIHILHLMEALGINSLNLGLPGAGPRAKEDVLRLAKEIVAGKLKLRANCAARTIEPDIRPIADVAQASGLEIEAATFLGSSPIRQYAENWTLDFLLQTTERAVKFARSLDLPVMYVTEDTTRARPEAIKKLYTTAIECGARAIVVCDTVGHVTPRGVRALMRFVIDEVVKPTGEKIRVDWHGHSDRGLAVANSLAAFEAGADQVHASALGIGERVGNTPMDQMLVNLKMMGAIQRDLTKLKEYVAAVSECVGVPIPPNYPVVGSDAFRTATGVHAAAVIKAYKKHDIELANQVYSGVPSHWFGMVQKIDIGPMSGKSTVIFWLEHRGIAPAEELVEKILARAKQSDRVLTEDEIMEICRSKMKVQKSPPMSPMDATLAVYCADIGSVSANHFSWCAWRKVSGIVPGTEKMDDLADSVAKDLDKGVPVALGFECPLFVPITTDPGKLTSARLGEGNMPWSPAAGCGALATGLVQVVWLLREIRQRAGGKHSAFLDWAAFLKNGSGLFIWEAFVSGGAKGDSHAADAKAAVEAFTIAMSQPVLASAFGCTQETYSLIGAALLRTEWSADLALLSRPCTAIRAADAHSLVKD